MNNSTKLIMIADDDPGVVDAMQLMLEFQGYQTAFTYRGSDLLNTGDQLPDLVLLDIWMSGEDGRDICRQFKANPLTQFIPVIMVSASRDVAPSALGAGADDFLAKPFDMTELFDKIERQLALRNKKQALSDGENVNS